MRQHLYQWRHLAHLASPGCGSLSHTGGFFSLRGHTHIYIYYHIPANISILPDAVAESIERRPRMSEIWSLVTSRVKAMTYKIDTCRFLAWHLELIG